jgi:hypothetical protein
MNLLRLFSRKRATQAAPEAASDAASHDRLVYYSQGLARNRRKQAVYPSTFDPADAIESDPRIRRAQVFEPSLCYFQNGFQWGEPSFEDPSLQQQWRVARRRTLFHLISAVADSRWKQTLILRGSALLHAWLGDQARDPGDLDWVVDPPSMLANSAESAELIAGLIEVGRTRASEIGIIPDKVIAEEIWTYDRAPGRRIVFPWKLPNLPAGTVQMDIVFQESFPSPKIMLPITSESGSTLTISAASPEQSLAWKILWLHTDRYPQGKDLYDAVLLAEFVPLTTHVLETTLATSREVPQVPFSVESIRAWQVDWDNFRLEYPDVPGDLESWKQRLIKALEPTLLR